MRFAQSVGPVAASACRRLHIRIQLLHAVPAPSPPQYEDDIDAGGGGGSFNILRCFVHLHGRQAPLHLAQRLGQLEAERERLLAALPREQQQVVRRRQAEAAGAGGGGLRWQVPPLVLDEAAFRRQFAG
jgi:hypothetical protein